MKDNFILYTQQYEVLEPLTDEQLGKLLRALYLYARDKIIPTFDDGMLTMAFGFVRMQIDASNAKYEEKRARLRQNGMKGGRPRKNQEETEKPNGFENNQEKPNGFENNQYSNVMTSNESNEREENREPSKEVSLSISAKPKVDAPKKAAKVQVLKIDYKAIKEYWNEQHDKTNSAMRRLTLMSEQRQSNVRARLREVGGDVGKIYQAIDIAMRSDFMNGRNGRGWTASFDWIMCAKNFPKVLEGNFTDEPRGTESRQQQPTIDPNKKSIGEQYQQAAHLQPQTQESQDNKYRAVIASMLQDLRKNPHNKPAHDSLARFYEAGVIQRLGIDWKP